MIAIEIASIKERLLKKASPKEIVFYSYFSKFKDITDNLGKSATDQLCRDAFLLKVSSSDVLFQLQKSKPIKMVHYSNNIIDLIAAATIDPNGEKSHIEKYILSHSLREAYLMHITLGTPISSDIKINSDIDKLIHALLTERYTDEIPTLFSAALSSASDIFDCLILNKLYCQFLSIHPDASDLNNLESIKNTAKKVSKALDGIIMFFLALLTAFFAVKYIEYFLGNADKFSEIQKVLIHIFSVVFIVCSFLGLTIPDKVRALTWARIKILTAIYWSLGLKYSEVEKLLKIELDNKVK